MEVRPIKMTEKLAVLVDKYWQDVRESHRTGKLVAWCSTFSPFEILRAMDITVVFPEGYGAACSVAGASTELCQRAESAGYSPDLCSVVRNFIGAAQDTLNQEQEKLPFGGLPKPDLLICQAYCPGIYKMWEQFSRLFKVPLWVMEEPRLHDTLEKDEINRLLRQSVEEFQRLIPFLERSTGRRLDYDRLRENLSVEREVSKLWRDVLGTCRNIPSPMSAFDAFNHVFPFWMYRCSPEAVTYYQELKSELDERIARKIVPMVAEEKYRLFWDNSPIFYRIPEHIQKFASYGAVPVVAMFPYYFGYPDFDPEIPLEGMAQILLFHRSNFGIKGRIKFLLDLLEGYSLDGLVMQRSRTCLRINMGQDDITEALIRETGLPAVVLEGDPCDSRFYSDSEFNSKIEAFMEILERRSRRRN